MCRKRIVDIMGTAGVRPRSTFSQSPLAELETGERPAKARTLIVWRGIVVVQNRKLRIVVADSDPRVRFALRILLREEPGLQLVGESSDVPSLVCQIRDLKPDLIVLDWELPGQPAAAVLLAETSLHFRPKVMVFSARPESRQAVLAAGADAFVCKGDPPEAVLSAFRKLRRESGKGVSDQEVAS